MDGKRSLDGINENANTESIWNRLAYVGG